MVFLYYESRLGFNSVQTYLENREFWRKKIIEIQKNLWIFLPSNWPELGIEYYTMVVILCRILVQKYNFFLDFLQHLPNMSFQGFYHVQTVRTIQIIINLILPRVALFSIVDRIVIDPYSPRQTNVCLRFAVKDF